MRYYIELNLRVNDPCVSFMTVRTLVTTSPRKGPRGANAAVTYAKKMLKRGIGAKANLVSYKARTLLD